MGIIATSPTVGITVADPTLTITAPADGASFPAPYHATIVAVATNTPSGTNVVRFYDNGVLLGQTSTVPYQRSATLQAGSHALVATLTDSLGNVTTSPTVTIQVDAPTSIILITAPTNGSVFPVNSIITITAQVTNPPPTPVAVEFYDNAVLIGTDDTEPYQILSPALTAGAHALVAKLVDAALVPVDCVLSPWSDWVPDEPWGACQPGNVLYPDGFQTRFETRTRTIVTPPSNGGAPCGPLSEQRLATQSCIYIPPPDPPIPPPGDVLGPADLVYLGGFKMFNSAPFPNLEFTFSQGLMTGRRDGGVPTLLLSGPIFQAGIPGASGVNEISIPAENTLTSDVNTMPRAPVLRKWLITSGIFDQWVLPNSGPPDNNTPTLTGVHYLGDRGNGPELAWTYWSAYGNPGEFPNVSTVILNNDGTIGLQGGPWAAPAIGWESRCGGMVDIPAAIQASVPCGPTGLFATVRGSAVAAPWGANLHIGTIPAVTTPPDNLVTTSIAPLKTAIYHGSSTPQARNTNYRFCAPNLPNDPYVPALNACAGGQRLSASNDGFPAVPPGTPGPFPVFGLPWDLYPGIGITLDWMDCLAWIRGPQKAGVISFGQLAETISIANGFPFDKVYEGSDPTHTHVGYGSGNPCCHGQTDPTFGAPGRYAGSLVSYAWFYTEAQMIAIMNGAPANGATPHATTRMYTLAAGIQVQRMQKNAFGGVWFDATAKRLYLSDQGRYQEGFDPLPVVHVFAVNC